MELEVHLRYTSLSRMEIDMNETLLIIEDNPENYYLMRFLLENNGFKILGADNGKDGINMAITNVPDAILLDIQLPEMDGYAVARELKKHQELDHVPIIAVTSYAMVGDKDMAIQAGASGYIEKPIDPDNFINQIREYLKNKGV